MLAKPYKSIVKLRCYYSSYLGSSASRRRTCLCIQDGWDRSFVQKDIHACNAGMVGAVSRGSWKVCGHWAGDLSPRFDGPQCWEDMNHQFHLYYLLWSCCLLAWSSHLCLFCLAPCLAPHLAVSDCQGTGNRKTLQLGFLKGNEISSPKLNLWFYYFDLNSHPNEIWDFIILITILTLMKSVILLLWFKFSP